LIDTFLVIEHSAFFNLPLIEFICWLTLSSSLSSTSNKSILLHLVSLSEEMSSLMLVFEPHLSGALASIKLDLSSATAATVARMLTLAELVEFGNHMLQILSIVVAEHN
jgi:hypothetical protein